METLEKHGGEDAYINIKYMIPTYESCMFWSLHNNNIKEIKNINKLLLIKYFIKNK